MKSLFSSLTVACLFLGTLDATAQRARSAPRLPVPEQAFLAPRLLTDLTRGPSNRGVLKAGDLDNDGDVDLLAYHYPNPAHLNPDAVQSWRNDGQGHFTLVNSMPLTDSANFELADVTNDGMLDIVVVRNRAGGTLPTAVFVYPGLGDGRFAARTTIFYGYGRYGEVLTADCDGDGDLDIFFRDTDNPSGDGQFALTWWRNEGGTFVHGAPLLVPPGPEFASLDFDGDGMSDVCRASFFPNAMLFYRTVNNALVPSATVPLPSELDVGNRTLRAGDLDGDGDEDVLVVEEDHNTDTFSFQPILNSPSGFTAAPLQVFPNLNLSYPGYLLGKGQLVDWDGDGDLDYLSPSFIWMENTGEASFARAGWVYRGQYGDDDADINVTDLNADGHPDLISQWACFYGDGSFPVRVSNPIRDSQYPLSVWDALEDWEGDGDLDLVTSRNLSLNNGDGSFVSRATPPPTTGINGMLIEKGWGDFDGDGFRDLVMAVDEYPFGFRRMVFFTGSESGAYQLSSTVPSPIQMTSGISGDLDGDVDLDILALNGFWPNDGTGQFGSSPIAAYAGQPLVAVDFDRDADLDLLLDHAGSLELLRNLGGLSFQVASLGISAPTARQVSFLDFDGDGDLDLAVTSPTTDSLRIFQQLPGGVLAPALTLEMPKADGPVAQIDVDGDGQLDLVASGTFEGDGYAQVQILSAWIRGPALTFHERRDWVSGDVALGFGDMDRDGDVDAIGAGVFENLRYDGPHDGTAVQYGLDAATSGTGGIHPVLGSVGPTRPGRMARLVIGRGRGGAFGTLLASDHRDDALDGGIRRLVLDPMTPRTFVLDGTPGAPGKGSLVLDVRVVLALIGRTRDFQVVLVDPGASSGLSATNGLEVHFGE